MGFLRFFLKKAKNHASRFLNFGLYDRCIFIKIQEIAMIALCFVYVFVYVCVQKKDKRSVYETLSAASSLV